MEMSDNFSGLKGVLMYPKISSMNFERHSLMRRFTVPDLNCSMGFVFWFKLSGTWPNSRRQK